MNQPEIIIIAAVADNGIIGAKGDLPWRIREDFRRFKSLTSGNTVIMGRRTWESLPRQPLPNRTNIILTRHPEALELPAEDRPAAPVLTAPSLQKALTQARTQSPGTRIYLIGGRTVYAEGLPLANTLELTRVHQSPEGDTLFPPWNPDNWALTASEQREGFTFETYQRRKQP